MKQNNTTLRVGKREYKNNSLTYLRRFNPQKDAAESGRKNGVIYLHSWGSGTQELVFDDDAAAQRWWDAELKRLHQKEGQPAEA